MTRTTTVMAAQAAIHDFHGQPKQTNALISTPRSKVVDGRLRGHDEFPRRHCEPQSGAAIHFLSSNKTNDGFSSTLIITTHMTHPVMAAQAAIHDFPASHRPGLSTEQGNVFIDASII